MKYRKELLFGAAAYLYMISSLGCGIKWLLFTALWLATGGTHLCYLIYHTFARDMKLLYRGIKVLGFTAFVKYFDCNSVYMFRRVVKRTPNKVVFHNLNDGSKWTYTQVDEYSNRVANFFLNKGFKKGDCVALYMSNRPEYVATWLGMAKIGVIPALINYNLKKTSLVHTITVAGCEAVIYGLELEDAIAEIRDELTDANNNNNNNFTLIHSNSGAGPTCDGLKSKLKDSIDLDLELKKCSSDPEPENIAKSIRTTDNLLYIYTSGTTGLPKAVIIKHIRQLFACCAAHFTIGLRHDDVIYCHLPLYHSSGGQVATASSLFFGATTVIRKKFSATNFWKDCVKYDVTGTQYIGEIARYLLAAPSVPEERRHKLRIMFGNGLRIQIWEKFTSRFNIPAIAEFYGATEGNSNIVNIDNKVGAVGYVNVTFPPFITQRLLPLEVIKVDKETKEPLRNALGFCIKTEAGEAGEFVGKIVRGDPVKDFEGYKDKAATKKKILANVFAEGDLYFRSGDVLVKDEFGYLYFKDRYGDTFRWKGENVSTTEVEATVSSVLELKDASSYGVEIPNTDGRAGMVAIPAKDEAEVDLVKLRKGLGDRLPGYAQPMFVRFVKEIDLTGTYKLKKNLLQKDGYDPMLTKGDPVFFLDAKASKYIPLTNELYQQIIGGKLRL